jgi:two-component system response regulator FlrC
VDTETKQRWNLLWIDGQSPDPELVSNLAGLGIDLSPAIPLAQLPLRMEDSDAVILGLAGDTEPLERALEFMALWQRRIPVVCRVERQRGRLAEQAMEKGAAAILATDESSPLAWRSVLMSICESPHSNGIFVDPLSRQLLALAQRVARAGVTALLTGPTGAGKEVLARLLHEESVRRQGPFVALNCAALPESMIEDLLFGHEKGAFTGALREHRGVFEQAHRGTLFLDEIAEMPMSLQPRLLRVLQERKVTRLGSQQPIDVDFRLVAATNRDLRHAIDAQQFREDLYFRMSTFRLRIAALAERPGDILPLAEHLLAQHAVGRAVPAISAEAAGQLREYAWPGNVRELSNVMQRALVLCDGDLIDTDHLLFEEPALEPEARRLEPVPMSDGAPVAGHGRLEDAVRTSEKSMILAALKAAPTRGEAARVLGISPRTLRYKLARFRHEELAPSGAAGESA